MMHLPRKHSVKWLYAGGVLFVLTLILLIVFVRLAGIIPGTENIVGFGILSLMVSAVVMAGGWFGTRIYFYTVGLFYIIAAGYMLYTALAKTAEGWTDLVGIVSFMFIIAAGVVTGILFQLIAYIYLKTGKQQKP